MSLPAHIIDGSGTDIAAKVTHVGQQVVAPYAYDQVEFRELAVNDTVYNFYEPKAGFQFVITTITAKADKQVSASVDSVVVIYEATTAAASTVTKVIYQDVMVEGDRIALVTNLLVSEGAFINAKASDTDIHMNILGYYIPVHD